VVLLDPRPDTVGEPRLADIPGRKRLGETSKRSQVPARDNGARPGSGREAREAPKSAREPRERDRDEGRPSARSLPPPPSGPHQAPPWLWGILGLVVVGIIASFIYYVSTGKDVVVTPPPKTSQLDKFKKLHNEAKVHRGKAQSAKDGDDERTMLSEVRLARQKLRKVIDDFDKMFGEKSEYRDPKTGELKPEYLGYEQIRIEAQQDLYNLNKDFPPD